MVENKIWRKCTTCKKPILFKQNYWVCSVSTCNRVRTDLVFCDLRCFDAHVPVMNHRDAGAFERKAPSEEEALRVKAEISENPHGSKEVSSLSSSDILVVASKVKEYIRAESQMNTSASVMEVLSDHIRKWSDQAIGRAQSQGRKTVMDRDC